MLARGKSKTWNAFDRRTWAGPPGAGRIEEGFDLTALLDLTALPAPDLTALLDLTALFDFPVDSLILRVFGSSAGSALDLTALSDLTALTALRVSSRRPMTRYEPEPAA